MMRRHLGRPSAQVSVVSAVSVMHISVWHARLRAQPSTLLPRTQVQTPARRNGSSETDAATLAPVPAGLQHGA